MENVLSFKTKTMCVCIDKYEKYSFNYRGWTIADSYVLNETSPRHSQYSITISSPNISAEDELTNFCLQGQKIAEMITELIPISGLPSPNSPRFKSFSSNLTLVNYKSAPSGWSNNYSDILTSLDKGSNNGLIVTITNEGFCNSAILEQSPLHDIQYMLGLYDDADETIKFLLFLNKSILSANDINVYMLIGKAIEIINALYPYKKHQKSKDRRIEKYFPELLDVFQDITIEKLLDLSNNRKEARHYVNNKNCNLPHENLSNEERLSLYRCSLNLIINVIRQAFELPHQPICFK